MATKKLTTAQKAAKAIDKARGTVSYTEPVRKYGTNLPPKAAKAKKQVERAEKAGAKTSNVSFKFANETYNIKSAKKTDIAASNPKTLKASGVGFKATARQVKLERERTATRAAAMAKKAKKK